MVKLIIIIIVVVIDHYTSSRVSLFKNFFASGGKGGIDPLTKILRTPPELVPQKIAHENGKLAQGIITEMRHNSRKLRQNCASLIKNDNDEEQLSVLTEFGYKDIKTIYFRHA